MKSKKKATKSSLTARIFPCCADFEDNEQQDAHELLLIILGALETVCKQTDIESVNFVANDFRGLSETTTACGNCKAVTSRTETLIDIPVTIEDSNVDGVENPDLVLQVGSGIGKHFVDVSCFLIVLFFF